MTLRRPAIDRRAAAPGLPIMGPRINLLPVVLQLRQRLRDRVRQWGVVLACASVLVLMLIVSINAGAYADHQLRTLLDAEQQRVQREERRSAEIAAEAAGLQKRYRQLQSLRSTESWSQMLRKVAAAAPARLIVRRIDVTPVAADLARPAEAPPEPGKPPAPPRPSHLWKIEGIADEYQAIVEYQGRLRQLNEFSEVQLMRSGADKIGVTAVYQFVFECRR